MKLKLYVILIIILSASLSYGEAGTKQTKNHRSKTKQVELQPSPEDQLVTNAEEAYITQNYSEAFRLLNEAYNLNHNPSLLYNLGLCAFMLENYPEAVEYFTRFLNEDQNIPDEKRLSAQRRLNDARSRYSLLKIALSPQIDCSLFIDGAEHSSGCPPTDSIVLYRGPHLIVVKAQGYHDEEKSLQIQGGDEVNIDLTLKSNKVVAATQSEPGTSSSYKRIPSWVFWSEVGLTGALFVTLGVFGGLFLDSYFDYNDNYLDKKPLDEQEEKQDEVDKLGMYSDIFLGLSLGFAVITIATLFFTDFDNHENSVSISLNGIRFNF